MHFSPYLLIDHVGDRSSMRGDEGCYLGFLFERQGTVELQSKGLPREASSDIRHSCLGLLANKAWGMPSMPSSLKKVLGGPKRLAQAPFLKVI